MSTRTGKFHDDVPRETCYDKSKYCGACSLHVRSPALLRMDPLRVKLSCDLFTLTTTYSPKLAYLYPVSVGQ